MTYLTQRSRKCGWNVLNTSPIFRSWADIEVSPPISPQKTTYCLFHGLWQGMAALQPNKYVPHLRMLPNCYQFDICDLPES